MITVKRGDTFAFFAEMKNCSGEPIEIPIADLKCQIRDTAYRLICEMEITETQRLGRYLFEAPDTAEWPIGVLLYDIKIDILGKITSTDTAKIEVIKDVTNYEVIP